MLQAVISMLHDLGFVSRHHIIPDRLARYVLSCYAAICLLAVHVYVIGKHSANSVTELLCCYNYPASHGPRLYLLPMPVNLLVCLFTR